MNMDDSIFAVKLYEMEEQYGKLQCRIWICERESKDAIRRELEKAEQEYENGNVFWKNTGMEITSVQREKDRGDAR